MAHNRSRTGGAGCLLLCLGLWLGSIMPAPSLAQTSMGNMAMPSMESDAGAGAAAVLHSGTLDISGAFARAMLPGQPVGGGYLTIANTGKTDERLLSVSSPRAGMVELHEMVMQGEVMKMRRLDTGIAVPAGQTVRLDTNGMHLMFMHVSQPFKPGETVPVTLAFEKAGKIELALPVRALSGK